MFMGYVLYVRLCSKQYPCVTSFLTTMLGSRYYHPHFIDEEAEELIGYEDGLKFRYWG